MFDLEAKQSFVIYVFIIYILLIFLTITLKEIS